MTDDFDDLDRALLALPLATPPAGLRDAILRATIWTADNAAPPPLSAFETTAIGVACAIGAWLVAWMVADHGAAAAFNASAYACARALGNPATVAWLGAGGTIAMLLTLGTAAPRELRRGRS